MHVHEAPLERAPEPSYEARPEPAYEPAYEPAPRPAPVEADYSSSAPRESAPPPERSFSDDSRPSEGASNDSEPRPVRADERQTGS
jgi:hypothetical protein